LFTFFLISVEVGSEFFIFAFGEGHLGGLGDFSLETTLVVFVEGDLGGGEDGGLSKSEVGVVHEAAEEPHKRLLELVVRLSTDVVVLEVLLAVEGNLLGFDFAVFDVDLVTDEHDGDVLADTGQILVPLGHIGVGDSGAHIEHDDAAVATNVVTIAETTELLLTCGVPNVELDLAVGGEERHGVHLNTEGSDVLLLKLTSQVTLDEGGLSDTAITDEDELELGHLLFNHLKQEMSTSIIHT
jgi:hypothetical protein